MINIITKSAKDTQGTYFNAIGGTVERHTEAFRYGGQFNDNCQYRVYGKYFDRGPFYNPLGPGNDAWDQGRFGFRTDWDLNGRKTDFIMIEGEHFVEDAGGMGTFALTSPPYSETRYGTTYTTGQHLVTRWHHVRSKDSDWTLQSYFDNFQRDTILNGERIKTFDIDFQYRFQLTDRQKITWGAGYRYIHDQLPSFDPFTIGDIPTSRSTFVASQFLQDEIDLAPDLLQLIVGCKLEQNSYTKFECQPTIRMLYTPDRKHTLWGAVSRAVHTPSRIDENMYFNSALWIPPYDPWYFVTVGNPDMKSETLMAYEIGYREQSTKEFSWDLALFYNVYEDLRSVELIGYYPPPPYDLFLSQVANGARAQTYGVELATNYVISERWKLYAQYTYLHMHIMGETSLQGDGDSPRNQVYVRSTWNLRENVDLDLLTVAEVVN